MSFAHGSRILTLLNLEGEAPCWALLVIREGGVSGQELDGGSALWMSSVLWVWTMSLVQHSSNHIEKKTWQKLRGLGEIKAEVANLFEPKIYFEQIRVTRRASTLLHFTYIFRASLNDDDDVLWAKPTTWLFLLYEILCANKNLRNVKIAGEYDKV